MSSMPLFWRENGEKADCNAQSANTIRHGFELVKSTHSPRSMSYFCSFHLHPALHTHTHLLCVTANCRPSAIPAPTNAIPTPTALSFTSFHLWKPHFRPLCFHARKACRQRTRGYGVPKRKESSAHTHTHTHTDDANVVE